MISKRIHTLYCPKYVVLDSKSSYVQSQHKIKRVVIIKHTDIGHLEKNNNIMKRLHKIAAGQYRGSVKKRRK